MSGGKGDWARDKALRLEKYDLAAGHKVISCFIDTSYWH